MNTMANVSANVGGEMTGMMYAASSGTLEDMVYSRVAGNGYGPYYQRRAWDVIALMPLPADAAGWEGVWHYIDDLYPRR